MGSRFNILPDPRFAGLKAELKARLSMLAAGIHPSNFADLLDPVMEEVLRQGFDRAGAHEGTVWLLDPAGEHLVPAYNTGPNAGKMVNEFKQPLESGLICMVLSSEQPFVENEVYRNAQQSKLLDHLLAVRTHSLMAVPFYFLQGCRGVISCVQLQSPGETAIPAGFDPGDLAVLQRSGAVLSRLLELKLLSQTVGWSSE